MGTGMEGGGLDRVRLVATEAWLSALVVDGEIPLDCCVKEERERRPASQIK